MYLVMAGKLNKYKVSIIIPTKDRYNGLCRAIDSIISQTHQNFEIIVVQDKLDDKKRDFFTKKYGSRIQFFQIPHQGRVGYVRNFGLSKSSGDFISFLDDDDWWHQDKLSTQLEYIENHGLFDAVVATTKLEKSTGVVNSVRPSVGATNSYQRSDLLSKKGYPHISTILLPRPLALANKFDETLVQLEDLDFILRTTDESKLYVCLKILCYGTKDIVNGLSSRGHAQNALTVYTKNKSNMSARQRKFYLSYILAPRCSHDGLYGIPLKYIPDVFSDLRFNDFGNICRYFAHWLVPYKVMAVVRYFLNKLPRISN